MKNILRLTLVLAFGTLLTPTAFGQTYIENARKYYNLGNYEGAQRYIELAQSVDNVYDQSLSTKNNQCRSLLQKASQHEQQKEYSAAKDCYSQVLAINPNDPNMRNKIEAMEKMKTPVPTSGSYSASASVVTTVRQSPNSSTSVNRTTSKYHVGQLLSDESIVVYVNATGLHGYAVAYCSTSAVTYSQAQNVLWNNHYGRNKRIPSVEEMEEISRVQYKIPNFSLGSDNYWTSSHYEKSSHGWTTVYHKVYNCWNGITSHECTTGGKHKNKADNHQHKFLIIVDF